MLVYPSPRGRVQLSMAQEPWGRPRSGLAWALLWPRARHADVGVRLFRDGLGHDFWILGCPGTGLDMQVWDLCDPGRGLGMQGWGLC